MKVDPSGPKGQAGFFVKSSKFTTFGCAVPRKTSSAVKFCTICTQVYKAKSAKHGKLFTGESFNHQELRSLEGQQFSVHGKILSSNERFDLFKAMTQYCFGSVLKVGSSSRILDSW